MVAIIPVVFVILGLVLYLVPAPTKVNQVGLVTFAAGVLGLALTLSGHAVRLLPS